MSGVLVDGVGQFFWRIGEHEFRARQPDRTIKGAAAARHDDFIFEAGGIGQLPDVLVISARHASCGCDRHGASRARGDHSRFCAGEFGQSSPNRVLQVDHVYEILRRFDLGLANFRKLQRATEVGPRPSAINDGLYPQAAVDILSWVFAYGGGGLRIKVGNRDLAQQRSGCHPFHE